MPWYACWAWRTWPSPPPPPPPPRGCEEGQLRSWGPWTRSWHVAVCVRILDGYNMRQPANLSPVRPVPHTSQDMSNVQVGPLQMHSILPQRTYQHGSCRTCVMHRHRTSSVSPLCIQCAWDSAAEAAAWHAQGCAWQGPIMDMDWCQHGTKTKPVTCSAATRQKTPLSITWQWMATHTPE